MMQSCRDQVGGPSSFEAKKAFVAMVFALLLGSCVSLLQLDGYASAVSELCDRYDQCDYDDYPSCTAKAGARLSAASDDTRAQWLTGFNDNKCLVQCKNTLSCMDTVPICAALGSDCDVTQECCGFRQSQTKCGARVVDGSQQVSCCLLDGQDCSADAECCGNRCASADGVAAATCGALTCSDAGQSCADIEIGCCPGLQCDLETEKCFLCEPDGGECRSDEECCGLCVGNVCKSVCSQAGQACASSADCCADAQEEQGQLQCLAFGSAQGDLMLCAYEGCLPNNAFCSDDAADCCSGHCDPNSGLCADCIPVGSAGCETVEQCCADADNCDDDGVCVGEEVCSNEYAWCDVSAMASECCSGVCGAQSECCKTKNEDCAHSVCHTGEWLNPNCPPSPGTDMTNNSCVADICTVAPSCCCHEWTDVCVSLVSDKCSYLCGEQVKP